jgi:hypothetical protein
MLCRMHHWNKAEGLEFLKMKYVRIKLSPAIVTFCTESSQICQNKIKKFAQEQL